MITISNEGQKRSCYFSLVLVVTVRLGSFYNGGEIINFH